MLAAVLCMLGFSVDVCAEPLSERTVPYQYNIASVSKVFVSVAVMQLYEQGKLDLDAPLEQYIPEFSMADERYHKITPRMLLNHTSGLMGTHYFNSTHLGEVSAYPKEHLLENLKEQKLKAEPGTYAVYCIDGFTLAEILVERVSGMEFTQYMEENICRPLQMENTTTSFSHKEIQAPVATNRYLDSFVFPEELEGETGSGGIHSTTEDLCRFATVFFGEHTEVLKKESAELMMQDQYEQTVYQKAEGDSNQKYGLGFDGTGDYIFDRYGIRAVSKGGDMHFQHANLTILPDEKLACAVTCSDGSSSYAQMMAQEILLTVLEEQGRIEREDTEFGVREIAGEYEGLEKQKIPDSLKAYAGNYAAGGFLVELSFPDDYTLQLKRLDEEAADIQTYTYRENGWFTGEMGSYIFSGLDTAQNGSTGISRLKLCTEQDGTRYVVSNGYMEISGFPAQALSTAAAVRVENETVESGAVRAWEKRIDRPYFLVNALPSSEDYDLGDSVVLQFEESGVAGFVQPKSGLAHVMEIVDEDHLKTAQPGRDMTEITVWESRDTEYVQLDDVGHVYAGEEILQDFPKSDTTITMDASEETKWYKIPQELTGKRVEIRAGEGGAVFFYDRYRNLVYSTHMLNAGESLALPREGYAAFAAKKGTKCEILYCDTTKD